MSETHDNTMDNVVLRYTIREAVEREAVNMIAPIRQQQQINLGRIQQTERDVSALQHTLTELNAIIHGNAQLGIPGIMVTVKKLSDHIDEINDRLDTTNKKIGDMTTYLRLGFIVLTALGIFDDDRFIKFAINVFKAIGIGL